MVDIGEIEKDLGSVREDWDVVAQDLSKTFISTYYIIGLELILFLTLTVVQARNMNGCEDSKVVVLGDLVTSIIIIFILIIHHPSGSAG